MGIGCVGEDEMTWRESIQRRKGRGASARVRGAPACSGWAEEAESTKEMEKRWASQSQRAHKENVCL